MEFAIGTHPAQANASPLALGFATIGPDKFLQLTIPKSPAAANIGYAVEVTPAIRMPGRGRPRPRSSFRKPPPPSS